MTVQHRKIQPGSDAQAPKLRTGLEMFRWGGVGRDPRALGDPVAVRATTPSPAWGEPSQEASLGSHGRLAHSTPPPPPRAPPPRPHSRFCVYRGRWDVVKDRKHSLPMSQSSKPGTWPWRLAQKPGSWSWRSTVEERGVQARGERGGDSPGWKIPPPHTPWGH